MTKTTDTHVTVDENLSVVLDLFRWFSALIVVIGHSRAVFFVPWDQVERQNLLATGFYFISGWGDYGVLMFFAISGFLIGGGALEKTRAGDFSFKQYFINRWTRIYIVLVPALLLVWALDAAGLQWLNGLGIYTQEYPIGALPIDTPAAIGPANFIYNLLMLQNVLGPPFGTAQPLWSLNWEWWSYMLAPFLVAPLIRMSGYRAIALCAFLALASALAGLGYVLLWHLGILLALFRLRYRMGLLWLGGVVCLLVPVATRATLLPSNLASQIVFVLGFVLLLSQLRYGALPGWMPNKLLAGFSYSLYVLHTTILVFLMAVLQTCFAFPRQLQPSALNYGQYLIFLLVVYAIAYVFALLTEANTGRLRGFIRKTWREAR
jgi:peptidoglycan/LPS O-acetylase OafA/YrhL